MNSVMDTLLLSVLSFKQLVFLLLILIAVVWTKKRALAQKKIILNSIWFSEDGSIGEEALHNLRQLAKKISAHRYGAYYQLFLWTDESKLQASARKTLQGHGVVIKDFCRLKPRDPISKKLYGWIKECLMLGNADNKFFYCIASDILRFYLLFKEFPDNYPNSVTCYFDCTDVEILDLPSPAVFNNLHSAAFPFYYGRLIPPLGKLLGYENLAQANFNNDLILAANKKNREQLDRIFRAFFNNLNHIDQLIGGIFHKLTATRDALQVQDQDLALVIVFGLTHVINFIRLQESLGEPFLLEYEDHGLQMTCMKMLAETRDFIDFKLVHKNSLTWAKSPLDKTTVDAGNEERKFWYEFFPRRYHAASNAMNQAIAMANLAPLLKASRLD